MSTREEYIRRMQAKLEEWNVEIDKLSARADGVKAEAKHEYQEQIQVLKEKQAAARVKVEELRHSGESALDDLKSGVDLAWTALGEAFDSARSRFK